MAKTFTPIKTKPKKADLDPDLDTIIYLCHNCGGKHTYGVDYFTEVGVPDKCPNCGTPFVQDDQIPRFKTDSDEDLRMKRDDLRRKRGEDVPIMDKPEDPEKIKQAEIERLENEIKKLKGQSVPGIKLGP